VAHSLAGIVFAAWWLEGRDEIVKGDVKVKEEATGVTSDVSLRTLVLYSHNANTRQIPKRHSPFQIYKTILPVEHRIM